LQRIHLAKAQSKGCAFFVPVSLKNNRVGQKKGTFYWTNFLAQTFAGAKVQQFFDMGKKKVPFSDTTL